MSSYLEKKLALGSMRLHPVAWISDDLEPFGTPDGDLDADLNDVAPVSCPYCGESNELFVDPGGGAIQEYVEDCEVCCQPGSCA